ncbi:hypothetical protein SY88_22445 [Clostridiales bacterium PH28_bin88]|nr:hypothetical protein SY88_22445 [Clostridiales bacterium PH28_bin88]
MTVKVGIPRALFYYYYFPLWKSFFDALGAEVITSPPTNKGIVDGGVRRAVDEACLPVKIFYGHVAELAGRVDYLFVPRLAAVENKAFICPKLMGLPDMLRAGIPDLPPMIDVTVDLSRQRERLQQSVDEVGRYLTIDRREIHRAWELALVQYRQFRETVKQGVLPSEAVEGINQAAITAGMEEGASSPRIAVLGHGYNLYDRHTSLDLIQKLRRLGAQVVTSDMLPREMVEKEASRLPKRMFWTLGKGIVGGAYHFLQRPGIRGIIHLASFGCGPDSLVGDLVERIIRRDGRVPFMLLTVDEHTGEAGVNTRLEAFMDMIAWRGAL